VCKEEIIMSWDVSTTTRPVAHKEYHCQASDWIMSAGLREADYEPADWEIVKKAKATGFVIQKGSEYVKIAGIFQGNWCVYRAIPEIDHICSKYDLWYE